MKQFNPEERGIILEIAKKVINDLGSDPWKTKNMNTEVSKFLDRNLQKRQIPQDKLDDFKAEIQLTITNELRALLREQPSTHQINHTRFNAQEIDIIIAIVGKVLSDLSHDHGIRLTDELRSKYKA